MKTQYFQGLAAEWAGPLGLCGVNPPPSSRSPLALVLHPLPDETRARHDPELAIFPVDQIRERRPPTPPSAKDSARATDRTPRRNEPTAPDTADVPAITDRIRGWGCGERAWEPCRDDSLFSSRRQTVLPGLPLLDAREDVSCAKRSEERRVGKECRS